MRALIGALVLVLIGLIGARFSFSTARTPIGPRLIFATGTHFLFLGFLLGSNALGLLTRDLIDQLYPFLALGLGWIGLLFGLQLERRQLREFPAGFLVLALSQAVLAFLAFWGIGALLLSLYGPISPEARISLQAAAATACISTPVAIALLTDAFRVRGRVTQLLFFIASLDAVVGIVALEVTYALHHPMGLVSTVVAPPEQWLLLATTLGVISGILFLWLTRPQPEREELVLFLLGLVLFAAGTALFLGMSPLFLAMVAGAVIANLSPLRRQLYVLLQGWEKPIYVILLILAGALLQFPTWLVVPLGLGYVAVRALAKLSSGFVASRALRLRVPTPPDMGLALLPQGGISIAMAISFSLTYPALRVDGLAVGDVVFSVVVLGVLMNELGGPFLTRSVLRRAGEISPSLESALAEGDEPAPATFPAPQRTRPEEEEEEE